MQHVVKMAIKVKCPTCGRECEYSDKNPYRPFCCERCRLIDLGAWAEGKYSIKDKPMEGDDDLDISADALATGKIAAHKADLESRTTFSLLLALIPVPSPAKLDAVNLLTCRIDTSVLRDISALRVSGGNARNANTQWRADK